MIREFTKSRIDKYGYIYIRMVKNRKIKKNWSNQDLKILVWIVAKYCEKKKIKDVYIGIVIYQLRRKNTIGSLFLWLYLAPHLRCACLNGFHSVKVKLEIKGGKNANKLYSNS